MRRGLVLVSLISLIAAACGTSTPSTAPSAEASQPAASAAPSEVAITPAPINADAPGPNGGKVIRWFIGLGTGGKPDQIAAETKVADDFNNSQKDVYLSVEIYDNRVASNQLQIEIAAGNAPDIIGPVGVEGLNIFRSQILDLSDLVTSQNFDMSNIDPKLVEFWKMGENDAMIGLPFATYPSFMYYNKNLFDEADLPYPPTKVGEQYQGKTWDMEAVRQLGMKLTVDKNGNDATSSDFDANSIVQWGFDSQWADNNPVAESTIFGAFSVVGDDGKTAQIPDPLKTGLEWYSNGVWKDHFIPTYAQIRSDLLGPDNEFSTGNLAMAETHSWYMCCINPAPPAKRDFEWGVAVAPSYNGTTTAKLHADTFSLLKSTKHPEESFKALTVLVNSGALLANYGAFPADPSKQDAFFDTINKQYPDVTIDWAVPQAMLSYPDIPNHQSYMPDYAKAKKALQALGNAYRTSELDTDAELTKLQTELQGIFDAAPE
jgi:multiple sugar transport system substrate-binding protein